MRDYGKVYATFWTSETIRDLSDHAKLLALYLMSCEHQTIAGVFRAPDGYVCEDLGWDAATVAEGFAELIGKGFANRCATTKWVWIVRHLEWNRPENPNQRTAVRKVARSIPDSCVWKQAFMQAAAEVLAPEEPESPDPAATLPEPFPNQNQKQNQKQKQEQKPRITPKAPRASRKVPTDFVVTEDMLDWAATEYPAVDVAAQTAIFRDHEFKTPRTDWQACWRTWIRRAAEAPPRSAGHSSESFRERDTRLAAQKVAAWTGGIAHDRKAVTPVSSAYPVPFDVIEEPSHGYPRLSA